MPPSFLELNLQMQGLFLDFIKTSGTLLSLGTASCLPLSGDLHSETKPASPRGPGPMCLLSYMADGFLVLNILVLEFGRNVCSA